MTHTHTCEYFLGAQTRSLEEKHLFKTATLQDIYLTRKSGPGLGESELNEAAPHVVFRRCEDGAPMVHPTLIAPLQGQK